MASSPDVVAEPPSGGIGLIIRAAPMVAAYVMTSMPYAHDRPAVAMTIPPRAGPTIMVVFHMTWSRASADGMSRVPTILGTMALVVGWATPPTAADSPSNK